MFLGTMGIQTSTTLDTWEMFRKHIQDCTSHTQHSFFVGVGSCAIPQFGSLNSLTAQHLKIYPLDSGRAGKSVAGPENVMCRASKRYLYLR